MKIRIDKKAIDAIAISVRALTIDAVQRAKSGHPGMPMGIAEFAALLYGEILKHNPKEPGWINRDRFVLSAGHGSMLLYSILHMSGYDISLDDIKNFRQIGYKTAGHPEYGLIPGVEVTTGPLGEGFANAVGMAIAERMLASRFNTKEHEIIDHYTYVISGDGCMMEGVASEAGSMAGHLGLGKLIVFYDSNKITIEGSTDLAFSEDVAKRYDAFNWHVLKCDAYDVESIASMIEQARIVKDKPSLIILNSIIAKGSPNMAGSNMAHGAPLGDEEVKATRMKLGVPENKDFFIHPEVGEYFKAKQIEWNKAYRKWQTLFDNWRIKNPELNEEWKSYFCPSNLYDVEFPENKFKIGEQIATRSAGGEIINAVARTFTNFVGGSADLAASNKTYLSGMGDFQKQSYNGRNIFFGVREHAMGSITNGIAVHGGLRIFCSTFFVFVDYMKSPMRLAAMMGLPVIYVFTHDSFYVGEDGPTHQPVEQLASLRVIPNMMVLRPADAQETEAAWRIAIERQNGPTAIILTRQNIEVFPKHDNEWKDTIKKGAYIAKDSEKEPEIVIIATGSEVELAIKAAVKLNDPAIRVVSMISRGCFLKQKKEFKNKLIPPKAKRLVIEAGVSFGWEGMAGLDGRIISVDRFGISGPCKKVAECLGFTVENVIKEIKELRE